MLNIQKFILILVIKNKKIKNIFMIDLSKLKVLNRLSKLMKEGKTFDEAVEIIKNENK
jgi:hypothetical protein